MEYNDYFNSFWMTELVGTGIISAFWGEGNNKFNEIQDLI